jgi:hypothetical protein
VDWQPQLEASLRTHDADLRRFMVANLDTFADRVVSDIRNLVNELPAFQPPERPPEPRPPYFWIAATLLALVTGIVLAVLHMRAVDANRAQSAEILSCRSDTVSLTADSRAPAPARAQHAVEAARASRRTFKRGSVD